jgi:FtsP/CotA-like multicopper oxidase with cupredoxin domain
MPRRALLAMLFLTFTAGFSPGQAQDLAHNFDVTIAKGKAAPRVLKAKKGDRVTIRVRTDRAMTLHLHGYDLEIAVPAGGVEAMTFLAEATGRYPVAEHGKAGDHHRALFHVEIAPR